MDDRTTHTFTNARNMCQLSVLFVHELNVFRYLKSFISHLFVILENCLLWNKSRKLKEQDIFLRVQHLIWYDLIDVLTTHYVVWHQKIEITTLITNDILLYFTKKIYVFHCNQCDNQRSFNSGVREQQTNKHEKLLKRNF